MGQDHRPVAEHPPGAVVPILVEHGPFQALAPAFAQHLRRIGGLDLLPGAGSDVFVVGFGLLAAETGQLFVHIADQVDGQVPQFVLIQRAVRADRLEETPLIVPQLDPLGRRLHHRDPQRLFRFDHDDALFDQAKEDHGHHLVERRFQEDGRFHGGQPPLDARALDGQFGWQVLHLAPLLSAFAQEGQESPAPAEQEKPQNRVTATSGEIQAKGRGLLHHPCGQILLGKGDAKGVLLIAPGILLDPGVHHPVVLETGGGERHIVVARLFGCDARRQVKVDLQAGWAVDIFAAEPGRRKLETGVFAVLAILVDQVAQGGFDVHRPRAPRRDGRAAQPHGHAVVHVRRVADIGQRHPIDRSPHLVQIETIVGEANIHHINGVRAGIVGKGDVIDDLDGPIAVDIHVDPVFLDVETVILGQRQRRGQDQHQQRRPNRR